MSKNQDVSRHYFVTVVIKPQGFNKVYLEGVFIPKGPECPTTKVKAQCWSFLKKGINWAGAGIDPEQVEKEIKVKAMPLDFVVCEDK